ncbi:MAG: glutamyl-tRNA reductase [Candidatus Margulisiibacteriota bacterium]
MQLKVLGLSHKTAPVEVREKIAVSSARLKEALAEFFLNYTGKQGGVVIVSTCNRTEIYTSQSGIKTSLKFMEDYFKISIKEVEKYLYHFSGVDAAAHLMRVSSGLDSMIVGEGQVLGQIKSAFEEARKAGTTDSLLNSVFNRSISCGKRSRAETSIARGAVTIGSSAAELARKIFSNLSIKQVLIVGAGKMSESAAKILDSKVIFVANRTFEHAQELAEKVNGSAVKFDELDQYLKTCDIVISSTSAPRYIISKQRIEKAVKERGGNPIFMIDIAVPRDIDPKVAEIPSVFLYDIDDLNSVAAENLKQRQSEIPKVEKIIDEEKEDLLRWAANSRQKHPRSAIEAPFQLSV